MPKAEIVFKDYINAGYPLLWINSFEEDRIVDTYSQFLIEKGYEVQVWDIVAGLKNHVTRAVVEMEDPVAPLNWLADRARTEIKGSGQDVVPTVVFLKDYHKFLDCVTTMRTLKNAITILKSTAKHLIIISPILTIPPELEKDVTVLDFQLPTVEDLEGVARVIIEENELKIGTQQADGSYELDDECKKAIASAKGLTLPEAENALSLSLIKKKDFSREIIEFEKLQAVHKTGLMELYDPIPATELGGLCNLKEYVRKRKCGFHEVAKPTPRGIIMIGLPGAGKSLSAKVIASELEMPLVRLDIASLKGSLVGQSEAQMRRALKTIDAISPCCVWLDEIEKSLGGVQSSNKTDGGTTSAMFGILLTWMQESPSPKYIIATCNDIDDLLVISQGALLRRFDDVFFVDLPTAAERCEIMAIMNRRYGTNFDDEVAKSLENFTGAEIEKICKASIYEGLEYAIRQTKPIFLQNRQIIDRARHWAKTNARIANSLTEEEEKKRYSDNAPQTKRRINVDEAVVDDVDTSVPTPPTKSINKRWTPGKSKEDK